MFWLILDDVSHQIVSCNIHCNNDKFELWVTRPNDKNLKITESFDAEDIREIKEAIDFAIENNFKALRI